MPSIDTKTTEKQGNIIITIYGNYEHISQHCDDYDYFCVNTLNYQWPWEADSGCRLI